MTTNWISKFQAGGAAKVNERYWHNKRYTPDQIKKIQAALNKQSLDKQIAVDGIFGPETLAAIKQFQQQHSDILKVDGLVGDQTASALGITGLGDSSLPQTRAGQNQARRPGIDTSTAQGRADKQASDYYNSPDMLKYLMNASNAAIGSPEYLNHYYNVLNYVSPEIASKLRALNNEGDAYDEGASRNRGQAFNRQVGIKEFKNAMASGVLNSPEALDKWMTSHNLSKEEMNELMADPSVGDAMLTAGVRADNGRVNSQQSQAKRFQQDVTNAINDAGVNYGLPAAAFATGLFTAPLSAAGSLVGGVATNQATDWLSKGKYQTWGQFMGDKTNTPESSWAWEFSNPGAVLGGFAGTRYTPGYKPLKMQVRYPNPRAGETYMTRPRGQKVQIGQQLVTPAFTEHVGAQYAPIYETIPGVSKPAVRGKWLRKTVTIPGKESELQPQFYDTWLHRTESNQTSPVTQQVPEYDTGTTYGPYIGINRTSFKTGGNINYQKIFK